MGRTQLESALAKLQKEIEKCENYKKRVLNHVETIKNKCLSDEITYFDYEEILNRKLEGKTVQEWIDHYDSHIERLEKEIKKEIRKFKSSKVLVVFSFLIFISLIIFLSFYFGPVIKGFISETVELSQELPLEKTYEVPLEDLSPSQEKFRMFFSKIGKSISGIGGSVSDVSKWVYNAITGLAVEDIPEKVEEEVVEEELEEEIEEEPIEEEIEEEIEELEPSEELPLEEIEEDVPLEDLSPSQEEPSLSSESEENITEETPEEVEEEFPEEEIEEEPEEEINITQAPILIEQIPDIEIGKNGYFDIKISDYFSDADQFYFLQVKDIFTTTYDHTIRISGEEDFIGIREGKIIVVNEFGIVESNFFDIIVSEVVEVEEIGEPELNITPEVNITENITEITEVNVTSNITITTLQFQAVIGKPVKWKKHIKLKEPGITKIRLPKGSENITVNKIINELLSEEIEEEVPLEDLSPSQEDPSLSSEAGEEPKEEIIENINGQLIEDKGTIENITTEIIEIENITEDTKINKTNIKEPKKEKARVSITGIVIGETGEVEEKTLFKTILRAILNFFKRGFAGITGFAITTEELQEAIEVTIDDNATEYEIEYETPAPESIEEVIGNKKRITISAADELNYTNILAFTELLEEVSEEKVRLYRTTDGIRELVDINKYDTNNNSLIDYIEWIVPHLSNQTYELIIEISKAEHLDKNRIFISDIYNETYELDGVWSETINNQEYVRVTFERNLTSNRDITLWPRIVSGNPRVEVYEVDGNEIVAEFTILNSNEYNKVFLDGSSGVGLGGKSQNVFDLRVVSGSLELDHVIDPVTSATYYFIGPGGTGTNPNETLEGSLGDAEAIWDTAADTDTITFIKQYTVETVIVNSSSIDVTIFCDKDSSTGGDQVKFDLNVIDCGTSSDCSTVDATLCTVAGGFVGCDNTSVAVQTESCTPTLNTTIEANHYFGIRLNPNTNKAPKPRLYYNSTARASNVNFTEVTSGGDSVFPDINITFPALNNTNTTDTGYDINYIASDDVALSVCWWTEDGGVTNNTLASCTTNITGETWTEGFNVVRVYANDTTNNINSSEITFRLDTLGPDLNFSVPTPDDGSSQSDTDIYVNISANDSLELYSFVDFDASLLGWWRMDDLNSSGDVVDLSTYSFNGTVGGNPVFNSSGYWGNATYLDGTGDFINFSKDIIAADGTASIWVNFDNSGTLEYIMSKVISGDGAGEWRLFKETTDIVTFRIQESGAGETTIVSNSALPIGGWHHIVVTWNSTMFMYIDGVKQTSTGTIGAGMDLTTVTFGIGDNNALMNSPMTGYVDEAMLFNRTLSEDEVSALYNASANPSFRNFTGLSVSTHTFKGHTVDKIGNRNETELRSVTISAGVPDINITFPALNNTNTTDTGYDVNYTGSDSDGLSVCWWTEDGGVTNNTLSSCTTNITGETWTEGFNVVRVYANDTSNNVNNSEITFRLDTTPPNFEVANLSVLTNETGDPLINFNATDNGIGTISGFAINWTDTFNISFADGNLSNISAIIEGNYYINASVNDTLGNTNYSFIILVNVTNSTPPSNTAPTIIRVMNETMTDISSSGPNEAPAYTSIIINFTAQDDDGAADLNDATAEINFTKAGEVTRGNSSCSNYESAGNFVNYTCNVTMWWFDGDGDWNILAYVEDDAAVSVENGTANFSVGLRTAFVLGPNELTFPGLAPGSFNETLTNGPVLLNNTGNDDIAVDEIGVNATDLLGEEDNSLGLYAGNFSFAPFTGPEGGECNITATNMTANIFANITGAVLPANNYTINDNSTGQEQLFLCLKEVGSELSSITQAYSTLDQGSWTVRILLVAVSFEGVSRLRKRRKSKNGKLKSREKSREKSKLKNKAKTKKEKKNKNARSNVSIPSTIFSKKLGALESVTKYLKENLGMSYHEIAIALNRDDRTIWTSYNKAIKKQKELIKIKETSVFLPVLLFKNRKMTVLEVVVVYLREKGLTFNKIARLIKRDRANTWHIYSNAENKIDLKEITSLRRTKENLSVPLTIFANRKLGALESVSKYLKENLGMSYHEIAIALNRDDRTIWTSYNKAIKKDKGVIKVKETSVFLPVLLFKNRRLTVLESVVVYLKDEGLRYNEIGKLLNRDQRNIWMICKNAEEKV